MTLAMDDINDIRDQYYNQGKNLSEIAAETKHNWKTIKKYVDKEDFNTSSLAEKLASVRVSKLDAFKSYIDEWLEADKRAPRKQRHTAKRVFNRLCNEVEGFNCSYRLVAAYVKIKKHALRLKKSEGHCPLNHFAGEAQADFGTAQFHENGKCHDSAKYLVVSFPFSNSGFMQLSYGENMECLLESLVAIFEHIGGVPNEIWFDNTKTIVTQIIHDGGRKLNERFSRFCNHYRITPVFMNPSSGWEKGSVENKVGYLRRNLITPSPHFTSLAEENRELLKLCDADMQRQHYDKPGKFIDELFEADKVAFHPLPPTKFDTALYMTVKTDKYGKFTLDSGKHRYSVSPDLSLTFVHLKITAAEVIVIDDNQQEIVRHRRLYGSERESMDWIPYLSYISKKPRSLRNSGIYTMMPQSMRDYVDMCPPKATGTVLKMLAELTRQTGFDSAVQTVNVAIEYRATDPESLHVLYRRIFADTPLLPPMDDAPGIPKQTAIPQHNDLLDLDTALRRREIND